MADLPSGVVTFLFTDIEGSSRLWEQHPTEMQASLARHDELLAEGIQRHGGVIVKEKGEGDSIFAVFPEPPGAIAAACAVQQALFSEAWPTSTPIRVRMALHTGDAQLRDGDYFGTAVNRCARLRSMTYGGQVMISEDTAELVQGKLPPGAGLQDLGFLQLRNLLRSEHVFQLVHPALPTEFPLKDTIPPCPYRGLFAFREEDSDFFFGRDRFIGHLIEAVHTRPLTAVLGPSGSGKSSLVFAGLLPSLMQKEDCVVVQFRPGAQPFYALAAATLPMLDGEQPEAEQRVATRRLAESLQQGHVELAELVERVSRKSTPPARVVFIADQFEELYTLCREQELRLRFVDVLLETLERLHSHANVQCNLLLTLRADFCGHTISYRPLADALQDADLKLGPMTRAELKEAIEKPAHKMGVGIEEGLTDRMLDAVSESPGDLPLLEFALTRVWDKQRGGRLVHAAYDDTGGVEQALAKYAEETFLAIGQGDQERARKVFVQLVQPGEATEDTRRVATRLEIGEENWDLVRRLADARLVVTGRADLETGQTETVEIVHEALIREWARFRGWMAADHDFRVWQERLRAAMRQWYANDRESGALLRGAPLAEAQRWLTERGEDLAEQERDYIRAGVALSARETAARERVRRRIITGLGTGLAIALVLMVLAGWQWFEAEIARSNAQEQAEIATGRRLAAQGISLLPNQYDLALLLGLESSYARLGGDFEARNSLLSALQHDPGILKYLHNHTGWVMKVAFSPDGGMVASASLDGSIILWDVATQTPIGQPLTGHSDAVNGVAFSPDGTLLASASGDDTIILWDVATQAPLGEPLTGHGADVWTVAFTPDGTLLASGSGNGTVMLWDVAGRQPVAQVPVAHAGGVLGLAFNGEGTLLATADGESVMLWGLALEPMGEPMTPAETDEGAITGVAFSPDGQVLATSSALGQIVLWDVETRQPTGEPLMAHTGGVSTLAFSPDGALLVSGGEDRALILWDLGTGRPVGDPLTAHTGVVTTVAFSPDGTLLASGGQDSKVILRSVLVPPPIGEPLVASEPRAMTGVAFSPDGNALASGSGNGDIVLWDPQRRQPLGAPLTGHTDMAWSLAFSPDGRLLASGSRDNSVIIWDVHTRQPIGAPLTGHSDMVWAVAFSPDGRTLASGSGDGTIVLWDVETRQPIGQPLAGHVEGLLGNGVLGLAFSPDGRLLASSSEDTTVILWNVESRQPIGEPLGPHPLAVWSVAFSPDGTLLAASSGDGRVILWDVESRQRSGEALWGRHSGYVFKVVFSPDGTSLASAGGDGTVILWDLERRQPIGSPLRGHNDLVFDVAFSPDGKRLASGSEDTTVILWDVDPDSWRTRACTIANRNMTEAEWSVYIGEEVPYRETCPNSSDATVPANAATQER